MSNIDEFQKTEPTTLCSYCSGHATYCYVTGNPAIAISCCSTCFEYLCSENTEDLFKPAIELMKVEKYTDSMQKHILQSLFRHIRQRHPGFIRLNQNVTEDIVPDSDENNYTVEEEETHLLPVADPTPWIVPDSRAKTEGEYQKECAFCSSNCVYYYGSSQYSFAIPACLACASAIDRRDADSLANTMLLSYQCSNKKLFTDAELSSALYAAMQKAQQVLSVIDWRRSAPGMAYIASQPVLH